MCCLLFGAKQVVYNVFLEPFYLKLLAAVVKRPDEKQSDNLAKHLNKVKIASKLHEAKGSSKFWGLVFLSDPFNNVTCISCCHLCINSKISIVVTFKVFFFFIILSTKGAWQCHLIFYWGDYCHEHILKGHLCSHSKNLLHYIQDDFKSICFFSLMLLLFTLIAWKICRLTSHAKRIMVDETVKYPWSSSELKSRSDFAPLGLKVHL